MSRHHAFRTLNPVGVQAKKRRRQLRRMMVLELVQTNQLKLYPQPWRWEKGVLKDRFGVRLASERGGFNPAPAYSPPAFKPECGYRPWVETRGFHGGGPSRDQSHGSLYSVTGGSFFGGPQRGWPY